MAVCAFLAEGPALRDGHGSCQVAVEGLSDSCSTLQVQFLYFMEVLLCALRIAHCSVSCCSVILMAWGCV